MWANKAIFAIVSIVAIPVVLLQVVTTTILGILEAITFGISSIPFSIVWIVIFYAPLMVLSWLWAKIWVLRIPIALIGIPLAVIGDAFVCLLPHGGDIANRTAKTIICETWPYSISMVGLMQAKLNLDSQEYENLASILLRLSRGNKYILEYVDNLVLNYNEAKHSHFISTRYLGETIENLAKD